ncbi:MAG: VanW family protein [Rubrobacter sp.]|nr:VanW family protein [Rubrobacter sp.]
MSLKNPKDRVVGSRGSLEVREVLDSLSDRRPRGGRRRPRIIVPVLLICALVATLVATNYLGNSGKIYPGVMVGSVDIGGKTPEEARKILQERTGELKEVKLTGPEELTFSTDRMAVNFDVQTTVDQAYAVGRQGGIFKRLSDRIAASWGTVYVAPVVDYNQSAIQTEVEKLAAQLSKKPEDAYVSVKGSEVQPVESREGYAVDVAATVANVEQAINDLTGEAEISGGALEPEVLTPAADTAAEKTKEVVSDEPVVFTAEDKQWKLSPKQIGQALSFDPEGGEIQVSLDRDRLREALSSVIEDLTVKPTEAGYKLQGGGISVTESKTGKKVEEEKLLDDIESGLFSGKREYEVPVVTDEPTLTTEEAERLKPTALLGSYRTNYTLSTDTSPERVENLQTASNAISAKVVAPGEVFSMNDVVSPLKYNKTSVIINGVEDKADGGGLCQVTSTLYMAANYAGLEIVERHPHYSQLPYIRPGLDATVWFGSLDMKFKNTTDGYLLLQESVGGDGYIYAGIYGRPTGKEVEMDSEPEYVGADSSKWITYQTVKENGKVTFDDVVHTDTYMPLVDEHGKIIPPNSEELNVAPVNP